MKQFKLLVASLLMMQCITAQESGTTPSPGSGKFHVGIGYTFLQSDLKICYLKMHSSWNEIDLDDYELNKEELDELNSFTKYEEQYNGLTLELGMVMLNKPGSPWKIDGTLMFGIAKTVYKITDTRSDTISITAASGFNRPFIGFEFLFRYNFSPHWGISLKPGLTWCWGKANNIDDKLYPRVALLTENRSHKFNYLYSRIAPMVSYTYKGLTLSAGPGFYLLYVSNEYLIERINPLTGITSNDQISSRLFSKTFFDGNIVIDWRIINQLTIRADCAFGGDIFIHAGIRYNF